MWNQAATTAVVALLGVILGAGLQYASSRALEGRKQLLLQKTSAYVDFFKAVALIAQHGPLKDYQAMAADAKVRACIYGSEGVIKILRDFEAAGAVLDTPTNCEIIARLLKEMRKDAGMNCNGITQGDMQGIVFGPALRQSTDSTVPHISARKSVSTR